MSQYFKILAANKGKGEFKAVKSDGEATIYLYDAIVNGEEESEWFGGVAPKSFISELKSIDAPVINLRINSPGGSVFAARAMEQALRDHPAKVIAHVDGYSASAASFLMMAADEIVISQGAMVMIHKALTMAYGNANDLKQTADLLDKIDSTLVETYATRTKQDAEKIGEWMAAETWFTAQEAVDSGFADRIAETKAKAQAWDLSAYANAPKAEKEQPAPIEPEHVQAKPEFDKAAALRLLEVATRI
jgi:ATP-dependent Clp protease, protease subunit